MYDSLSKLFTTKNILKMESLKYELRTPNITKEDILFTFFVKIEIIRYGLLAIDEMVTDKELVITTILGLPPTWGAFDVGLSRSKETPTFEELWKAYSQEELKISMVANNEEV